MKNQSMASADYNYSARQLKQKQQKPIAGR